MRTLDLDALAPDPEAPFRNREICIDGQRRDVVRARIESEKDALPAHFATPMTALVEDRWKPLVPGSSLTPEMRAKVQNLVGPRNA